MSLITAPSTFRPQTFSMRLSTMQNSFASPFGGSEQVVDLMNDRWEATVTLPPGPQDLVASREAFVNAMRGQTNTVALYHYGRPIPRGTMRGSPLSNGASVGANSMVIGASAGVTLLAGDMIGVGGLLLQVASDCVADGFGVITVPLVNRVRKYITAGLPVIWDRPTAEFRLVSKPSFVYAAGYAEGAPLDFVESIT
jgi:hypothetical protein